MKYILMAILLLGCTKQTIEPTQKYFASSVNADWLLSEKIPGNTSITFRFVVMNVKGTTTAVLYEQGVATSVTASSVGNANQTIDIKTPKNWDVAGYWGLKIDGILYSLS